jgi:hypothetical protein
MMGPTNILGPDGKPVSSERVRMEKQTRFNPLRGWTPDVLVRQLEAYSRGDISALSWVMEWLEKHDDVIATVAPKAKAAVSRWGYDILPKDEISPEAKQLAQDQGLHAILIDDDAKDSDLATTDWMLLSRDAALLKRPEMVRGQADIEELPGLRIWTDSFNNLFQILK